jgi:hypothetical protein
MNAWAWPDYQGGGIVNLMQSIRTALGDPVQDYSSSRHLAPESLATARNVVLLVLDGLGYEDLVGRPEGALRQHLRQRITSVAPPTTATAISTFLTGLAPQQHGLTGWFTYFRELGSVLAVLPFVPRCGGGALGQYGVDAAALYGHVPIFDRLSVKSYSICPDWIAQSDFNRAHLGRAEPVPYRDLEGLFAAVARTVRSHDERKYVYAYWPGYDRLAHERGVGSAEVAAHFAALDAAFATLLSDLAQTETLVIATADHGFVDVPPPRRISLAEHPDLKACLSVPLCGEQRLCYAYVTSQRRNRFEDYVADHLADVLDLHPSETLLAQGLFGPGEPHPELARRIGDYTLVMKPGHVIQDRIPGEGHLELVGYHGGLSPAEMYVPLIVASC